MRISTTAYVAGNILGLLTASLVEAIYLQFEEDSTGDIVPLTPDFFAGVELEEPEQKTTTARPTMDFLSIDLEDPLSEEWNTEK